MNLSHIVKYHKVFFKVDNGPYGIMLQELWPLFMKNYHLKLCPLSNLISFDQNFMKLGHIV